MSVSKFLLLLGVSGVGKTTIIQILTQLNPKFIYISPYVTRSLREGEYGKISISDTEMDEMATRGEFLTINTLFGIRYANPITPVHTAFAQGNYPLLDWPAAKMHIMRVAFPSQLYVVYIKPPSLDALKQRLAKDGRDNNGHRIQSAIEELEQLRAGKFTGSYDLSITSSDGEEKETAQIIYCAYLAALNK